eukprot:1733129-Prymnesium_polylepis.2
MQRILPSTSRAVAKHVRGSYAAALNQARASRATTRPVCSQAGAQLERWAGVANGRRRTGTRANRNLHEPT